MEHDHTLVGADVDVERIYRAQHKYPNGEDGRGGRTAWELYIRNDHRNLRRIESLIHFVECFLDLPTLQSITNKS